MVLGEKIQEMPHDQLLLTTVIDTFLETLQSDSTIRAYRRAVQSFLLEIELDRSALSDLFQIKYEVLCSKALTFLSKRQRIDQFSKEVLNPRSINLNRYALSSFFQFLQNRYKFPHNPVSHLKKLKVPDKSNTPPLTEHQALKILQILKEDAHRNEVKQRDFLIVLGLFLLALRRKEVANLRWDQIIFDQNLVRLNQKGSKERVIPVPKPYLDMLLAFREQYQTQCPYVFRPVKNNRTKVVSKPISPDYIYYLVKRVASTVVPEKRITPHSFRTSFVTLAFNWGEDPKAILHGTGHGSYEMLMYYHMGEVLTINAIHTMGKYLSAHDII
ncbi:MAG: tyrosine-type recombinase/integrase [Kangiellaceae bacterium]|jgi:integrase|nr:tyrosine-type recombinase/integrase [Kangiellaceae bacterium]